MVYCSADWKDTGIPRIGISRKDCGKGLPLPPDQYAAIATDEDLEAPGIPVFGLNQPEAVADFILRRIL